MTVPDEDMILQALGEAGPRSTSWLCLRFDVRGEHGFQGIRAKLDRLAELKKIKLDTMGMWTVVAPLPTKAGHPPNSSAA